MLQRFSRPRSARVLGSLPPAFTVFIYLNFMISQCPQCRTRPTDFAVSCDKCGWSIVNPDAQQPATSTETSNGQSPAPPAQEPTISIVKQVAKTAAPPPPEQKSTEDVPPQVRESNGITTVTDLPPQEIDLQIQKAMDYIEQENYTSALSYLNRAIIDVPPERLAECFSLRGYVHLKNLDFVRSENDCTQAISQNWEEAQTYAWRAAARGEQNKWRETFDDLEKACELAGSQRDQYLTLMDSYSETASEYYRELIKNGDESADLFFDRGWIYFRSGKYQKAERDFNHSLAIQPDHAWASVGLAKLRYHQGEMRGIRDLCDAGTLGDADCERAALEIRAQLNQQDGKIGAAQRDLNQLIELAGDDSKRLVECCRLRNELGDHVKAIEVLTKVLDANPEHHLASLIRGDCYRSIKNYSMAINDYSRYLRFYPDDVKALVRRADMLHATERLNLAHIDLEDAMAMDKTNFDAYLIRSKIFLQEEKLDQALTDCQKSVRLDNQKPEAFAVLAEIYRKLCDFSLAIEEYGRSVELASTDQQKAHYLYHRGTTFYEMEDFEKALDDFAKSCELRPHHSGSWIWKAATCARIEKWSDAIKGLQQAIAVRPSAAEQYQQLGKPVAERAISYFNNQLQRGGNQSDLYRQRGLAYQFLGKDDEAIRDYTAALNKDPDDCETLTRRGQGFARKGDHGSACDDFTHVIRKRPDDHGARYWRAISRAAEGKMDEAKSDVIKAIKAAPQHPRYHILLAELQQKGGNIPKVIEALDKAILQDPTDPFTYRRRGNVHVLAQNYINAISDFTHSLELYPAQIEVLVQRGQAYLKSDQPGLAIEDFELALTHNNKLAKAYSGRATALAVLGKYEYTLIWLTKAIHRFDEPRELAEILFSRGKVFYLMGRLAPAVSDFSVVNELMRGDTKIVAAARYARAIANVHGESWDAAKQDFCFLLNLNPMDDAIRSALDWLENRESERPKFLGEPAKVKRPTRPPPIRSGVSLVESESRWAASPPYDTWVVRNIDKKEYGPVYYNILKTWIQEGRVDIGMKLLRADWSKWKRAEKIFSEIAPLDRRSKLVDDFPGIDVRKTSQPVEAPSVDSQSVDGQNVDSQSADSNGDA
jgi:tetratricopeptide (TPR) repeat protein